MFEITVKTSDKDYQWWAKPSAVVKHVRELSKNPHVKEIKIRPASVPVIPEGSDENDLS